MNWRKSPLLKVQPHIAEFLELVLLNDLGAVCELLERSPSLAQQILVFECTKERASDYFVSELGHYIYSGDTALHIASMAHCDEIVGLLLDKGANISAVNRRGAQAIHYACDGSPSSDYKRQELTVGRLIAFGADPNCRDKSGVSPIHRAVRQRCTGALKALIAGGADVELKNKSGSSPLLLAQLRTGRGGSGTPEAKAEQKKIIEMLLAAGARQT
jgi:hypothetical protein